MSWPEIVVDEHCSGSAPTWLRFSAVVDADEPRPWHGRARRDVGARCRRRILMQRELLGAKMDV